MSLVSEDLTAGFTALISVAGESITVNGVVHSCIASELERGYTVSVGGREEELTVSFVLSLEGMLSMDSTLVSMDSTLYTMDNDSTRPIAGRLCSYRGTSLRIASVTTDPSESRVTIRCISPHK